MVREIKGWHVLTGFICAFGIIISVNMILAFKAVQSFPGLEVKNSYVASQSFDAARDAQEALGWEVSAFVRNGILHLSILENNQPIAPKIERATFGRATSVRVDQTPEFTYDGTIMSAPVTVSDGNWNLRIKARAEDGTLFQQRIIVEVKR